MPKSEDLWPRIGMGGVVESDPIATPAIKSLSDAVALLPTNTTLTPIKDDITSLQTAVTGLASKADLAAANAVLTTVADAVKVLEASGSPAALKALQDAVAQANADIAALKKRQDDLADALQKATQAIADLAIIVAKGITDAASEALVLSLQTRLDALDKSKADKVSLDALTTTVTALNTAIANTATDKELSDAIAAVDTTIAALEAAQKAADDALAVKIKTNADNIQKNKDAIDQLKQKTTTVVRYGSTDTAFQDIDHWAIVQGATALTLPKATLNRFIGVNMLQSATVPELTADTGEQFFVYDGKAVVASTDGKGTLDQPHSLVLLVGRAAGGWDATNAGGAGGSNIEIGSAILATLPAKQWTSWPVPTGATDFVLSRIESAFGEDWTTRFELNRGKKQVKSLVDHKDVLFIYEVF